jgi:hypothetical protein
MDALAIMENLTYYATTYMKFSKYPISSKIISFTCLFPTKFIQVNLSHLLPYKKYVSSKTNCLSQNLTRVQTTTIKFIWKKFNVEKLDQTSSVEVIFIHQKISNRVISISFRRSVLDSKEYLNSNSNSTVHLRVMESRGVPQ